MCKRVSIILMILMLGLCLSASEHRDTLGMKIYFHQNEHVVDQSFRGNLATLQKLYGRIDASLSDSTLVSVNVQAWASPEGGTSLNERLSVSRTSEIARLILENSSLPSSMLTRTSGGVGWHLLREAMENSTEQYKDDVISILDKPLWEYDSAGRIVGGRTKSLMDLEGGSVWKDLNEKYFPSIRCCLAVVISEKVEPVIEPVEEPVEEPVVESKPVHDTLVILPPVSPVQTEQAEQIDTLSESSRFHFAFRSDLLEDAALIPNIGIDFYLGKGWTLGLNWRYAWWDLNPKPYWWRIYGGELNLRKYFGRRAAEKPLQGHHLGVYGQILTYDFELGEEGIMGGAPGGTLFDEFNYGAGLEYGYSLPVCRKLNIDFSIGAGYFGGKYREYLPIDGCYVWQSTKNRHYWGPTKAEVSLVWLLGKGNENRRKGGER